MNKEVLTNQNSKSTIDSAIESAINLELMEYEIENIADNTNKKEKEIKNQKWWKKALNSINGSNKKAKKTIEENRRLISERNLEFNSALKNQTENIIDLLRQLSEKNYNESQELRSEINILEQNVDNIMVLLHIKDAIDTKQSKTIYILTGAIIVNTIFIIITISALMLNGLLL